MRTMSGQATNTMNRRATRDQLKRGTNADLADGVGGTITGAPMAPIDLMEILSRGARGGGSAGAVSGAAQVVVSSLDHSRQRDQGFALSDGSRITFASIADAGVLTHDDGHKVSEKAETPGRHVSHLPAGHRSGVLTSA